MEMAKNHTCNDLLLLDSDAKAVALKSIKDMYNSLSFLHEMIVKDTCTVSIRYNAVNLATSYLEQLKKAVGADEDIAQDKEAKRNWLLEANTEVERLKAEIGKGVTSEAVGHKIELMRKEINDWWQSIGFSYTRIEVCGSNQFKVEFSTSFEGVSRYSERPVTDKEKITKKKKKLKQDLQVFNDKESDEEYVLDNDNNKAWFTEKLKERFPDIKIHKWDSRCIPYCKTTDAFHINNVEAYISFKSL